MSYELPLWGFPRNPFDLGTTDPMLPALQFAATPPPLGPQPTRKPDLRKPDPLEDRKKRIAASLAQEIMEINDVYYPKYSATSSATADEKATAQQTEEKKIIDVIQLHLDDANLATDTEPSPHARQIAALAATINSIQIALEAASDDAEKQRLRKQRKDNLITLVGQYIDVGQPRPVAFAPTTPLPQPSVTDKIKAKVRSWKPQRDTTVTTVTPTTEAFVVEERPRRRTLGPFLLGTALGGVLGLGFGTFVLAPATSSHPFSTVTLTPGNCLITQDTYAIAMGQDFTVNGDAYAPGNDEAVVLKINTNKTKICARRKETTVQEFGGDSDKQDAVAQEDQDALLQTGCSTGTGCRRVPIENFS